MVGKLAGAFIKKLDQSPYLVVFRATSGDASSQDIRCERRVLFLRNSDWVLPQPRIHVLLGDHRDGLFARNRCAAAEEWFGLRDDLRQYRAHGKQSGPRGIKRPLSV